jgi:hypothetical protein
MARYILNEQFVRGVNQIETMYFPATSAGPKPPSGYMGQPSFPDLMAYVRRMSYLMAMGRPDASVALFLPSSSMWLGNDVSDTQFVSTERLLSEHQIDFDIVDEDALAHNLKALPGSFETLSGNRYRTVILPAPQVISADMLARLETFAHGGGKVLFLGGAPTLISDRTIRNSAPASPADFSWAAVVNVGLSSTPTPPAAPPAMPPQPQVIPIEVIAALKAAVIAPIVAPEIPTSSLRVMKRRWKDADVYLFFNESADMWDHGVWLLSKGKTAETWDPQTGTITPLQPIRNNGAGLGVPLPLQPYETRVIVVR